MLIVFEGIDGCGKATQIAKLGAYLRQMGKSSAMMAYPDMMGPLGRVLEEVLQGKMHLDAEGQFFVFLADIARDQQRVKEAGKMHGVTILDRYCLSTIAYQVCKGFDRKRAVGLVEGAGLAKPDIIILLGIDAKAAGERKSAQKQLDKFEADLKFQDCVRKEFLALARKKFLCKKWAVVDASGTPEEVFAQVRTEIDKLIK